MSQVDHTPIIVAKQELMQISQRIAVLGGEGMPNPAEKDSYGYYTYMVVKNNHEFSCWYYAEDVIALCAKVSASNAVAIESILRVYENGKVDKMSIEFTGGKLQLVQVPSEPSVTLIGDNGQEFKL